MFITYASPEDKTGFVAVELKYSESMNEPLLELMPRYAELAPAAGLFADPMSPALRTRPLQQFFREHLLAQAILMRGDYGEGRFVVVAPRLNNLVQNAAGAYRRHLAETSDQRAGFASLTLEKVVEAIGEAGEPDQARALCYRYLDLRRVDQELDRVLSAAPRHPLGAAPARAEGPSALLTGKRQ